MCGISFYCSKHQGLDLALALSLAETRHRGPDSNGSYFNRVGQMNIGLGHNRLSILDLSPTGHQPMESDDGITIAYNGEVYNHLSLRQSLEDKGYAFKGHSDTETVLNLYREFGESAFAQLNGMFSFVLFDPQQQVFYVVRDTLGIKPVYLYQDDNGIIGCSEIKGLKAFEQVKLDVDNNDVFEFFNNGFLYEPATGFKAVKKLLPGHFLKMDLLTNNTTTVQYAKVEDFKLSQPLDHKIESAIKEQLVADVKVGTFFSGGIDSSIIASHSRDNELFFAKYDSDPSADIDLEFSQKIARFFDKDLVAADMPAGNQTPDALMEAVDFVAKNSEELMSDFTFWPTYLLSKKAKQCGFKVMLSGMGGDEAFGGYPRYLIVKYHWLVKLFSPLLKFALRFGLFPKKLDKRFERLISYIKERDWTLAYSRLLGYFSRDDLNALFEPNAVDKLDNNYRNKLNDMMKKYIGPRNDKVKQAQFLDRSGFLAHNLSVSDKASMLASIELRVPLLAEQVFCHGATQDSNELIEKRNLKAPLKHLLASILPKRLIERPKTGFNPPLDALINNIGEPRLQQELARSTGFIDHNYALTLLQQHFAGKANHSFKLWQLLYFSRWVKFHA